MRVFPNTNIARTVLIPSPLAKICFQRSHLLSSPDGWISNDFPTTAHLKGQQERDLHGENKHLAKRWRFSLEGNIS